MRLGVAALTLAVGMAGCAAPERSLLERFFGASRLRDTTALQSIATVIFEPREQGIVRTFEIAGVSPERRTGQATTKDVHVDAPVVLPDGKIVRKRLVVTLRRIDGSDDWLVTAVRDAEASPPAPPS